MYDLIKERSNNIGALVSFIKNNNEYLEFINSNIPLDICDKTISERVFYFINKIKESKKCICGDHLSFIGFKNGHRKTCAKKECVVESRKKTCIKKFGVDNPKKSKLILEKEQNGILEKWGGNHFMKSDKVKSKFKSTMIENWGVEYAQQNIEIKEKSFKSWCENIERENIIEKRRKKIVSKTSEEKIKINEKKIKSIIKKFGSLEKFNDIRTNKLKEYLKNIGPEHYINSSKKYKETITKKIIEKLPDSITYIDRINNENNTDSYIRLHCKKCEENFEITRQFLVLRTNKNYDVCIKCNPTHSGPSIKENDILDFIQSIYDGEIISNTRNLISPKEIDIYLPNLKLAIEFDGLYWHSEKYRTKKYHLNKTKRLKEKDISLFHIWEDDWDYKQDIVKSMISHRIGKTKNKIWARKCDVKVLNDNKLVREFLTNNHLQGFVGSKVKLGLFYNEELVSIMTFGNLRKSLGQIKQENKYELLRFCNILNTNVVGGASKLFKYFIRNFNVESVISYADYSRSNGDMYVKLGFVLNHLSDPNYYYIIDGVRKHRFNFRKDKLVKEGFDANKTESEIMKERNILKIYDCGSLKLEFKK